MRRPRFPLFYRFAGKMQLSTAVSPRRRGVDIAVGAEYNEMQERAETNCVPREAAARQAAATLQKDERSTGEKPDHFTKMMHDL